MLHANVAGSDAVNWYTPFCPVSVVLGGVTSMVAVAVADDALPAASVARTTTAKVPSCAGRHEKMYGGAYFVATTEAFTSSSPLPTPTSSAATAETASALPPVAPIDTVGAMVSGHVVSVPARAAAAASRTAANDDFG